ncbi:MAG: DNA recombination protein RmuC [Deltaproteobacteria bacterium]|nr:DNA recombination protein RmuC [Deltaproteobacteria bacterium]
MEIAIIVLLGLLVLGLLGLFFIMAGRSRGREVEALNARYDTLRSELQNSLSSNLKLVASELNAVTGAVTEQLSSVTSQIQASTGQINQRMDSAARVTGEVKMSLGALSKAAEQIFEVGKDISGLQEILKAPKIRGGLGELFLGDLLGQCLPTANYELQYRFSDGLRVDAAVKFKDVLVPIDSKFPLENFRRIFSGTGDEEKRAAKRRFVADCKKHIDAIASSYIRPEEGTLNFALMYIPAENVYYETIVKDTEFGDEKQLTAYAFAKRVVPVSPNSFYAYLQTVLLGLKGLEMDTAAREMMSRVDGLKNDFDKFMTEFDVLGRHIGNAKTKYDEAQRKADRFAENLSVLGESKEQPVLKEGAVEEKV